ncbi:hypothetical protein [Pontibacter sp. BAB1700]|uniref:hypothetical protein n=1 Tax=Pontibacter sp. BAB1700 TaxID=1144253 RepID=UPI00026BD9E5|nr:hypothetical protein [Pontibacter sp. BAB1700]EJF10007.1 hypothetical protein O71_11549 [Pontibacter sp. BAB1700]
MEAARDNSKNAKVTVTFEGEDLKEIILAVIDKIFEGRQEKQHPDTGVQSSSLRTSPTVSREVDDDFFEDLLSMFKDKKSSQK